MPARLDIALQRNEDYAQNWTLADNQGAPIDITGWSLDLQVKDRLNNSFVVESARIELTDPENGEFDIHLRVPGRPLGTFGDELHTYRLPYDLIAKDTEGVPMAIAAGYVILSRGISQ